MKKLFFTITILLLSISFYPVKAMEKTSDILKKNVVTEGDGLYVDSTIDGRYIYKGGKPNNYIKLGNDLYRIISLEKDGTIKVIKQESIGNMAWDEANARYSTNDEDFCTSEYGCNSWGSNTTTLDSNGNKVTQMPWEVNGTLKNLPDKEATLNTYLNNDFYNSLNNDVKSLIVETIWNIGPTVSGPAGDTKTNLSETIKEESAYKWKGKIALMSAIDYVKATTNSACTSVSAYRNPSCYNNSSSYNYLYSTNYAWTLSSHGGVHFVFGLSSYGMFYGLDAHQGDAVIPAFYLSSETTLNGEGTEINPYTISNYIEESKNEENNNEVNINNGQIVEVPSTSAFGSIVIVILGIICVIGSIVINKKMTK